MKRDKFLENVGNQNNHRPLLWEAMKMTTGKVVEFGSGHGSTPYMKQHCEDEGREFESFDNSAEWAGMTGATLIDNWDLVNIGDDVDVLLIDHAPGERRKIDIAKYANKVKIMVVHDTEPAADHGYQMRQHFGKFRFKAEIKTQGAWATILSNSVNLSTLIGVTWKDYTVRGYNPAEGGA